MATKAKRATNNKTTEASGNGAVAPAVEKKTNEIDVAALRAAIYLRDSERMPHFAQRNGGLFDEQ